MSRLLCIVALIASALAFGGCQAQRNLDLVREMGDRNYALGDYPAALTDYQEYVTRKPDGVDVRYSMAMTELKMGQPQLAREQLYQCLAVHPDNQKYAEGLAEALLACNEREELITFLTREARDRGRPGDYERLGHYQFQLGNVDEAKLALITAAKLENPKTIKPQMELADLYRSLGDKENELKRLRMALYIEPRNQDIQKRIRELGQVPGPGFTLRPE
ncbi:MAG: tetratricopeptide repeat protein [Phycisphaerales bacterium]